MSTCRSCERELTADARFCPQCGTPVDPVDDPALPAQAAEEVPPLLQMTADPEPGPSRGGLGTGALMAIIAIVLVVGIAAVVLLTRSSGDDTTAGPRNAYPADAQSAFLSSCESAGTSTQRCQCALTALQDNFTYAEYQQVQAQIKAGTTPEKLQQVLSTCGS
jgi:hypothetical protein